MARETSVAVAPRLVPAHRMSFGPPGLNSDATGDPVFGVPGVVPAETTRNVPASVSRLPARSVPSTTIVWLASAGPDVDQSPPLQVFHDWRSRWHRKVVPTSVELKVTEVEV